MSDLPTLYRLTDPPCEAPNLQPLQLKDDDEEWNDDARTFNEELERHVALCAKFKKFWNEMQEKEKEYKEAVIAVHNHPRRYNSVHIIDVSEICKTLTENNAKEKFEELRKKFDDAEKYMRELAEDLKEFRRLVEHAHSLPHAMHEAYALYYDGHKLQQVNWNLQEEYNKILSKQDLRKQKKQREEREKKRARAMEFFKDF